MNSLLNYGSDDDLDDSPDEKYESQGNWKSGRKATAPGQDDTNYDEVQMSLSEDSDNADGNAHNARESSRHERDNSGRDERDNKHFRNDKYGGGRRNRDGENRDDRRDREGSRRERRSSRSRSRDRYDKYSRKDRRRSRSRERRRSRSPKRDRSRSRSRDRGRGSYPKRYDKANRDRLNSGVKVDNQQQLVSQQNPTEDHPKDRFFMPGITGRFREQIEKRKLLWQKNKEPEKQAPTQTTKVWETTTFAQDQDGKVANKFKRLMGIRSGGEGSSSQTDVLKKQEEMFTSMEAQYEVARTATHTMRGVGLGFGSYQR